MTVFPQINAQLHSATEKLTPFSSAPRLEAEVLLMHVLEKPRAYLYAWPEQTLSADQAAQYQDLLARRLAGEPIAYLTGTREFWSRLFLVSPDVLIPRPETELLVELALERIPERQTAVIADLGTGSGAIAVTIALERPQATVIACDISPAALRIAQANAARLGADNLEWLLSDWFTGLPPRLFDTILSNPPYIAKDDPHLRAGDVRFEPQTALVSGQDGLDSLRQIAETARHWLKPDGWLLLEHGYDQAAAVQTLLHASGYAHVRSHCDLAGHARVTLAQQGR